MPNWENYYSSYEAIPSFSSIHISSTSIQQQFEEWQRECQQQDHIMEQQIREAEEEAEDKKKYPLFYWQQTCKPVRK